jgi:hypothetical protein
LSRASAAAEMHCQRVVGHGGVGWGSLFSWRLRRSYGRVTISERLGLRSRPVERRVVELSGAWT